jgi:hypothetical protein
MKFLASLCVSLFLAGCATGTVVQQSQTKIDEPKRIGLDAPLAPWVPQIEARLRQKGFTVKRISRDRYDALTDKFARYILVLGGSHYTGWERRCFGGGWKFEYVTAELIDMENNESVVSITGEGYSENCPPASGTIFEDIATAVASQWK